MELRDYFKIFGRYLTLFIVVVILTGLSAFLWTKTRPQSYLASTTVTVNKASTLTQENIDYYLYDNYYNIQSAGLFSQIVVSWFSSPALVKEIYEKAGVTVPNISQSKLSKTFKAVRQEPSTINVSISGTNKEELGKLINAATEVLQDETNKLSKNSDSFYELAKFTPILSDNKSNLGLNTLIGLLAGLLVSIILVLGIEYFKGGKKS